MVDGGLVGPDPVLLALDAADGGLDRAVAAEVGVDRDDGEAALGHGAVPIGLPGFVGAHAVDEDQDLLSFGIIEMLNQAFEINILIIVFVLQSWRVFIQPNGKSRVV